MRRILGIALALACSAGLARAQTFVSGVGDDVNPCSRTAPCKTFTGALAQTAAGGEIDVLDPGDFGTATITKSVTINGLFAGSDVLMAGVEGLTIAAGASDVVILRGLSFNGQDGGGTGLAVTSAGAVYLEQSWISGFTDGVVFEPAAGGSLFGSGNVVKDNSGSGIVAGSSGGTARVLLNDCRVESNGVGIHAIAGGRIDVYDSDASRNSVAGVSSDLDSSGGSAEINLESVNASENGIGVNATAPAGSAIVRLSKVLGTANTTAPVFGSGNGELLSFGDNRLDVVPALSLTTTMSMQTVKAGAPADYPLAVGVVGLLSAPITFSCSGLPAGATCNVSPATLIGITTGNVTLSIATTATSGPDAGFVSWRLPTLPPQLWLLLAMLALALMSRRPQLRRTAGAMLVALAVTAVVTTAACSSSPGSKGHDMKMPGGGGGEDMSMNTANDMGVGDMSTVDLAPSFVPTPPGTYNITVTATSGKLTATLPLTLTVN